MAHDQKVARQRRFGRREAIALFGFLAGMASAALLTQFADRPAQTVRVAI